MKGLITPNDDDDDDDNDIAEGVEWPEEEFAPPDDAKDLVSLLLQHNSVERLGSGGAHEVKEHLFFDGIDWQGLLRQKAEFVPQLEHDEDTSYFDSTYRATHYCMTLAGVGKGFVVATTDTGMLLSR